MKHLKLWNIQEMTTRNIKVTQANIDALMELPENSGKFFDYKGLLYKIVLYDKDNNILHVTR